MAEHVSERFSLEDVAVFSGTSKSHLCRAFRRQFAIGPFAWLWKFRTVLAAELLRSYIKWDIQQIGFKCGFSSSAHFSRAFKRVYGVTPGVYRKLCVRERERGHFRNAADAQNSDHFRFQMIRAAFEKIHA